LQLNGQFMNAMHSTNKENPLKSSRPPCKLRSLQILRSFASYHIMNFLDARS
jgi:hypothetical protein